jgi:DNA-binding NarL/FixJ family response regulator
MRNRRHDANTSVTGGRAAIFGPDVDVIVLTTDLELLGMLQEASGPEHILWHAQSANEAVELLVGGRCGVLIADLQVLRGEAAALLEKLQAQFPELVLLAMGRRDEEQSIGPLVTSGRVYRFLHKPLSPARANVFLSTAARRYVEISTT